MRWLFRSVFGRGVWDFPEKVRIEEMTGADGEVSPCPGPELLCETSPGLAVTCWRSNVWHLWYQGSSRRAANCQVKAHLAGSTQENRREKLVRATELYIHS